MCMTGPSKLLNRLKFCCFVPTLIDMFTFTELSGHKLALTTIRVLAIALHLAVTVAVLVNAVS